MRTWIVAGATALALIVPGGFAGAQQVTGKVAQKDLYPLAAETVILKGAKLSSQDRQALMQVGATQKYYGAVAISPDEGLMAQPSSVSVNFHNVPAARTAALADCNAKRKKDASPCAVVAEIAPKGYKAGAKVQLSADATAAYTPGQVMAVSLSTGHWGTDKSARAAIAACEAMGGAKDCKVAITN